MPDAIPIPEDTNASRWVAPWLRHRPDVKFAMVVRDDQTRWVVRDPVSLVYFRMREDERFVLELLDGYRSEEEIRKLYNARFPEQRVTTPQIRQLLFSFYRAGLVTSDNPNQAGVLQSRAKSERRTSILQVLSSWMFVRLPGVHAEPLVKTFFPLVRWVFEWPAVLSAIVLFFVSSMLLVVHRQQFWADVPAWNLWVSTQGFVTLGFCVCLVKVLHELGHAFVCKRFGGECHEIGILLMFFVPALYCEMSDAWLIRSRWQRMLVGAAGMITELVLGSIAILVWWFTQQGFFHVLAIQITMVCFLGTCMINANPLLRYDGYYILSDWLDIPNLAQESQQRLDRMMTYVLTGRWTSTWPSRSFTIQLLLLGYAIVAIAYRWLLMAILFWFVLLFFKSMRLEATGWLVVLFAIGIFATTVTSKLWVGLRRNVSLRRGSVRPWVALCIMVFILAFLVLYPTNQKVVCPLVIHRASLRPIVVTSEGSVEGGLEYERAVKKGGELAMLRSVAIERELQILLQQRDQQSALVRGIERAGIAEPAIADQLPTAKEALAVLEIQLEAIQRKLRALTIVAPFSGDWVEPLAVKGNDQQERRLPRWSGSPISESNRGAVLTPGSTLGWVRAANEWEAVAVVEQSEIEWVHPGQRATIFLNACPERGLMGEVAEVSIVPLASVPPRLASVSGGSVPVLSGPNDASSPITTSYYVRIKIASSPTGLEVEDKRAMQFLRIDGLTGNAKIQVDSNSWGGRVLRWLSKQLRFA